MNNLLFKIKSFFIEEETLFQKELINELLQEHKKLVAVCIEIEKTEQARKKIKLLNDFYYLYKLHSKKEEKQLYTYLKIKFRFVDKELDKVDKEISKINEISKFVDYFHDKYKTKKSIRTEDFKKDFETITTALVKRVEFEEGELFKKYDYKFGRAEN